MKTKKCTRCNNELPATKDNFHAQKNGKFGLRSACKLCSKVYRQQYTSTKEYKEYHKKKQAEWRLNNPEKEKQIRDKFYNKHKERLNSERKVKYATDSEYKQKCLDREKKYKESGRRYEVQSKPDQREAAINRSRKRRHNSEKRRHDYKRTAKWREENKEHLNKLHRRKRIDLAPSYVAQTLRIKVKDLTPEILETKRLIILIKRELKNNNVKIR